MTVSINPSPVFQAQIHPKIENFSIIDTKIKSIFKKIFDFFMWAPQKIYHKLHVLIGSFIYPAPRISTTKQSDLNKRMNDLSDLLVKFKTPDGAEITGALIKPKIETPITLIYFLGNADNFLNRSYQQLLYPALVCNVNILYFNYRDNFPSSGPVSKEGLILDGDAAFQYARSLGYEEKNIILHGSSLGGAIAAQVAELHPDVNYCNDRSFSKLSTEIKQILGGGILGKIAAKLASFFGWELDTLSAWEKIQGNKWIIYNKRDGIIKEGARLCEHFENQEFTFESKWFLRNVPLENISEVEKVSYEHTYDIFNYKQIEDLVFYVKQIQKIRSKI